MMQQMLENGYSIVEPHEKADIYIINTCTVTNMADRKSRQMTRRVKEQNPSALLIVCGCYAQVAKEELEQIEGIDILLGTDEKTKLIERIQAHEKQAETYITDVMHKQEFSEFGPTTYSEKTRAVIKIQDGCDRFCSYCIIPYARGKVRSRKPENILEEVKQIAQKGIKEIVLTGIHIASYGKDFETEYRLIDLLEALNSVEGIQRIRLGSLEPTLMTESFVNRMANLEKICDHFHLSLQSGCNETLKRMNRKYTTEEFEEVTKRLRKVYPQVALTTDIIVGFPGETEEEFQKTYQFLEKIAFYKMHIFKYSKRKGTLAANMPNQVPPEKQEERSKALIALSDKQQQTQNKAYIGKTLEVLLEETENGYTKGHTTNYIEVKVPNVGHKENQIIQTQIETQEAGTLVGAILDHS